MNKYRIFDATHFTMICILLTIGACSSPGNKKENEKLQEPVVNEEKPQTESVATEPNYFAQVFESIEHISSTPEPASSKMLLPRNEWNLLPQEIQDTIPDGGKVFILAKGASLNVDRSLLVEVELPGTSWPFYLQYLLALNNSFEVVMHHRLFSQAGEEQYNVQRHNIWKYGMGDMLSIAIDNGPWNYNVVYWELLTVQDNSIQLLESKSQSFEELEKSEAYFNLIRDSPVDREDQPLIKLSELSVDDVTVNEETEDPLEQYGDSIPSSEAISLVEQLGFEVSSAYSEFYKSDDSSMFIPMVSDGESFKPNYDVLFCMGETSYFFTKYDFQYPSLLIQRQYDNEVHRWGIYESITLQDGALSFVGKAEEPDDKNIAQSAELPVKMFRDAETNGWIIQVGDEYFAMKQTLMDKFGVSEGDLGCG